MRNELDEDKNSSIYKVGRSINGDFRSRLSESMKKVEACRLDRVVGGYKMGYGARGMFSGMQETRAEQLLLVHPDPKQSHCVFADASEHHWGSVVTQATSHQMDRELESQ